MEISNSHFVGKHLKTIQTNYGKASHFRKHFDSFTCVIRSAAAPERLIELNCHLIEWFMALLEIKTRVIRASQFELEGTKCRRLAAICENVHANVYLSPLGSAGYLLQDLEAFIERDIRVDFHNYDHPTFSQLFPPFLPNASVIDLILNEGSNAVEILRSGRRQSYTVKETAALNPIWWSLVKHLIEE